jgi:hypothetical protein
MATEVADNYDDLTKATEELLALGLFVFYKWDKISYKRQLEPHRPITPKEINDIVIGFTQREISEIEKVSRLALEEYKKSHNARSWWSGVFQSVVGAFIYSLFILLAALIVKFIGSDIVTVLKPLFV